MNKDRFEIYISDKTHVNGIRVKNAHRKFLFDTENDEIFFAAIAESDVMCALFDNIEIRMLGGHPYLPCSWLKQEFPNFGYQEIEKVARAGMSG